MPNIKERPYELLLFTAIALLVALTFQPIASMNFQNKTMFSVPLATIVWFVPLLLISLWLAYLLTRRFLYSIAIARIHVLITITATVLIMTVLYVGINPTQLVMDRHEFVGNAIQILSLIFILGQFTYLVNVLLGLFRRQRVS